MLKLELTEEQQDLRMTVQGFLAGAERSDVINGLDKIGVLALPLSEEVGGGGAGIAELAIVARELGRVLVDTSFVPSSILAMLLVSEIGTDSGRDLARRMATREVTATAPWQTASPAFAAPALSLTDGRVSGDLAHVPYTGVEQILVADAIDDGGIRHLVSVEIPPDAVELETAFDIGESVATLKFHDVPAINLIGGDQVTAHLRRARAAIQTVLASELVGSGEQVLRTAVEYAKTRFQFGRAIGSFQSIKHMLADAYIALDAASALADRAAFALDNDESDAELLSRLAFASASSAAQQAALSSLQTFGGIGYTWEQGTHRFLRHARSRLAQFGSFDAQLASIANDLFPTRGARG